MEGFYPLSARGSIGHGTGRLYLILRGLLMAAIFAALTVKMTGVVLTLIALGELPVFVRWFMEGRRLRRG